MTLLRLFFTAKKENRQLSSKSVCDVTQKLALVSELCGLAASFASCLLIFSSQSSNGCDFNLSPASQPARAASHSVMRLHRQHPPGSDLVSIFYLPQSIKQRFLEAGWSLLVDLFLMNIPDVFCQYFSDHMLPQRLPFQLAAPLLHIACVIIEKTFLIMPCPVSAIDELVWMVLLYML